MFVVIDEAVEQALLQLADSRPHADGAPILELDALVRDGEGVTTVGLPGQLPSYLTHSPGEPLPSFGVNLPPGQAPSRELIASMPPDSPVLFLISSPDAQIPVQGAFFHADSSDPTLCEVDVVRLETDIFSRLKGIFDTTVLASKVVCIIGVGSGGSTGALELAKSGVGNFILVDFDRLRAHNVSRHVCGLADVGRFKTRAVKDMILQHSPMATVQCHETDITQDDDLLAQVVSESDLIFVATDNELSRYLVNEACLAASKPAVYGGAYERAFAGEIIRVIPGEAGCYACVRQGMANTMRSISSQQVFDYTDNSELQAEPGLGLDVSFIAMIHTKIALMTLLRGTESIVGDIDAEMVLWTNTARPQDGELFERAMTRYLVRIAKSEKCSSCGVDSEMISRQDDGQP